MKKKIARLLTVILVFCMMAGVAGCGKKEKEAAARANAEAKKYVFRMENLENNILGESANVNAMAYLDGRIYIVTTQYRYDEMTGMQVFLKSSKLDGSDMKEIEIFQNLTKNDYYYEEDYEVTPYTGEVETTVEPRDVEVTDEPVEMPTVDVPVEEGGSQFFSDSWVNCVKVDENGVYMVMETYGYEIDGFGNYIEHGNTMALLAYDLNGNVKFETKLETEEDEYVYFNTAFADKSGNVILVGDKIWIISPEGKLTNKVEVPSGGWINYSFVDRNGAINIIMVDDAYTKLTAKILDPVTGQFVKDIELLNSLNNYTIYAGSAYDYTLVDSSGIYGYNIGDKDVTQILSYINSDIDCSYMNNVYEIDSKTYIAVYYDEETWTQRFAKFTYVDPADVPDKTAISLACYYLDGELKRDIIKFNRESEEYRIIVKCYQQYATMEDYEAGYKQLNNDIVAGNMPDILVVDADSMPFESYIAKGLLADVGKLIKNDDDLNWDDYMTNVFEAYSVDGKLYSVIPSFYVSTIVGKTSLVGDTPGWTMDDLKALMAKYPDATVFDSYLTRDSVLWNVMQFSGSRFVNRDTGTCHFDSEEFIDMLEFLATFPTEYDWESMDDDYWMSYETQYRDNRVLLQQISLYNFSNIGSVEQGQFGEDITFIGFPAEEGIGAVITVDQQYAIAAKSKAKDGAWEFLKQYLMPEYQMNDSMWRIPVYKEAVYDLMEEAQEKPYWINENGDKEYYDNTYWIGNETIVIEPLTKEEAQEVFDYVSSIKQAYYFDQELYNIITEEAAAYFAGDKTAKEVASIIQSRAFIYISENR